MRRHACLVFIVLLLASCTAVEDFGGYWDKGVIDPALEGPWKKTGLTGMEKYGLDIDDIPGADQLLFVKAGTSYSMRMVNPIDPGLPADVAAQRKKDNEADMPTRTLRAGGGTFMMVIRSDGVRTGMLQRYEIVGDVLREMNIDNGTAVDFLEAKYPNAPNIGRNRGEGRYVVIHTFDEEVYRVLTEMAANPAFWNVACEYRKMR